MTKKEKRVRAAEYQRQRYWRLKKQKAMTKELVGNGLREEAKLAESKVEANKSETKDYSLNYCPNCGVHLTQMDLW